MTPLHIATPLLQHAPLSRRLDKHVLLKMENLQPSGSFKLRGIGALCQRAVRQGALHLVCPSGGNAGCAAAVAGAALGVRTTVVVPHSTPDTVRQRIGAIGAAVMVCGANWNEANAAALQLCGAADTVYVPPFDHADIWDGNASLVDEACLQARGGGFDAVVCAVGGGGLMCGVLQGLHRNGLAQIPLIAVETEGAAALHASLQAGRLTELAATATVASSLASNSVAQQAFDWTRRHEVRSITVSDAQAVEACLQFADDLRTLVEPACGAALAVAYQNLPVLQAFRRPLIVVCGGIGVDLAKLAAWKTQFRL